MVVAKSNVLQDLRAPFFYSLIPNCAFMLMVVISDVNRSKLVLTLTNF